MIENTIFKISKDSNPNSVAGAIAGVINSSDGKSNAILQAVGAGALNQAIKAVCIARGFVAPSGYNLVIIPAFCTVTVNGEERTGIKLVIKSEV